LNNYFKWISTNSVAIYKRYEQIYLLSKKNRDLWYDKLELLKLEK